MQVLRYILCCAVLTASLSAQQTEKPAASSPPLFEISGVVVNSVTGEPVPNAGVVIASVSARDVYTRFTTGEDGRFTFSGLAAGKYTLNALRRGYLTRAFNQHEQYSSSIAVGPGMDSTGLVFRLPPDSSISGKISDEAGEPVIGASVFLYESRTENGQTRTRLHQQVVTNDEGTYHFGHLQPARYFLAVAGVVWYAQRPAPHEMYEKSYNRAFFSSTYPGSYPEDQGRSPLDLAFPVTFYPGVTEARAATPISIKSGERFVADMMLQPVPALALHFGSSTGVQDGAKSNSYPRLQAIGLDGLAMNLPVEPTILPSGEMQVTGVAPGQYQFQATGSDGSAIRSGQVIATHDGDVAVEHETHGLPVTATVTLDPSVAAVQGNLQLTNTTTSEAAFQQLSGPGDIEFKRSVQPGTYQVAWTGNGSGYIQSLSATGAKVTGRTLEITGPGAVHLAVTLAHGQARIHGIALRDDKGFAGAMVVLVPSDLAHNQILVRRDQSDSDGTFTLISVVPGTYTVLAIADGWDLEWQKPAVLKPYLPGGEVIEVKANGNYDVKVKVQ